MLGLLRMATATRDDGSSGRPLKVLIVGHGPPTTGGIPTFVSSVVADRWLRHRVDVAYLNTAPRREKRPGAMTMLNLWLTAAHAVQVTRLAPAPILPLIRAGVLAAAAKAGRARVILHIHTGQLEQSVNSPTYRFLLRIVRPLVDEFVVVSTGTQKALNRAGIRSILVENGIDVDAFRTGPKADPPGILYVGTVCERKGLLDLKAALQELARNGAPPAPVAIVGDGAQEGPGAFDRIRAEYVQARLDDVRFLGSVDHARVRELLADAWIFCFPSHWEAFPLALLEAMAAGTAIVGTAVGDVPRILAHGEAGMLVEPNNPNQLAAALGRLLDDSAERARLGRAARTRAEQEYRRERMTTSLFDLYREVAER
jgi:glycosyltransferase involved in cell wall biosynthesis